jgi:hypothetical protein
MKVHILGPRHRSSLSPDEGSTAWLGIDVDMDDIPAPGEKVIINGGTVYAVTDRTWFVNVDEPGYGGDLTGQGQVETVHLMISPDEAKPARYELGYSAARTEIAEQIEKLAEQGLKPRDILLILTHDLKEGS